MDLARLPGGDLIVRGLEDLSRHRESAEGLLVAIGAPRLRKLGFEVPEIADAEHKLYRLLCVEGSNDAHSRYNALLRKLVSFERAAECAS